MAGGTVVVVRLPMINTNWYHGWMYCCCCASSNDKHQLMSQSRVHSNLTMIMYVDRNIAILSFCLVVDFYDVKSYISIDMHMYTYTYIYIYIHDIWYIYSIVFLDIGMPLLESKLLSLLLTPVEIGPSAKRWKIQFRLGLAINSTTLILITAYQYPKILY